METISTAHPLLPALFECRNKTETICRPLKTEDYVVQPIEYVSPPKWHLGHTTWFFEHFILKEHLPDYRDFHDQYAYIFNSYYEAAGDRIIRTQRGNLSRPTVQEIYDYRAYVDKYLRKLMHSSAVSERVAYLIEIGINHEQQHQELLYYDIKYILGHNPLMPAYSASVDFPGSPPGSGWIEIPAGVNWIGYNGSDFCYDNELAYHQTYTQSFSIRDSMITNGEYLEFIESGGYQHVALWHSPGWTWIQENKISSPLYWHQIDGIWNIYTFNGIVEIDLNLPVQHLSYYEAAAFMAWKGWRLPTEQEWEVAADHFGWGELWEWTESAYLPYPGYEKEEGALGEYNGKFMVNQKVLRGASFVTSEGHSRKTYRNFFHPEDRWQFAGIRPVKDQ